MLSAPLTPPSPSPLLAWVGRAICCACSWYLRQRNRLNVRVAAANLAPYKEPPCIWWSLQINSHPEGRLISTGLVIQNAKFVLEMALLGKGSPEPLPKKVFGTYFPGIRCPLGQSLEKLRGFAVPLPSSQLPFLSISVETFSMSKMDNQSFAIQFSLWWAFK